MLCDAAFELISAHLDGTNTPAEEAALQAHLSECPACQALLETMTALELNTKNLEVPCPPQLKENIMARIETEAASRQKPRRPRWLKSAIAFGGIAAVLALVLGTGAVKLPQRSDLAAQPEAVQSTEAAEAAAEGFAFRSASAAPAEDDEVPMEEAPAEPFLDAPAEAAEEPEAAPEAPASAGESAEVEAPEIVTVFTEAIPPMTAIAAEGIPDAAGTAFAPTDEVDTAEPPRRQLPKDNAQSAAELTFCEDLCMESGVPVLVFYNLDTQLPEALSEVEPALAALLEDAEVLESDDRIILELDVDAAFALVEWLQGYFPQPETDEAAEAAENGEAVVPEENSTIISEAWDRILAYDPEGLCLRSYLDEAAQSEDAVRTFPDCFAPLLEEGFLWELLYPEEDYEPVRGDPVYLVLQPVSE